MSSVVENGTDPFCAAPSGPFRQKGSVPFFLFRFTSILLQFFCDEPYMQKADGMNYAPQGRAAAVCRPGEFRFGVIGLDHGHIYGMCNGLVEAGGELAWVYDPDPNKLEAFRQKYPNVQAAHRRGSPRRLGSQAGGQRRYPLPACPLGIPSWITARIISPTNRR